MHFSLEKKGLYAAIRCCAKSLISLYFGYLKKPGFLVMFKVVLRNNVEGSESLSVFLWTLTAFSAQRDVFFIVSSPTLH